MTPALAVSQHRTGLERLRKTVWRLHKRLGLAGMIALPALVLAVVVLASIGLNRLTQHGHRSQTEAAGSGQSSASVGIAAPATPSQASDDALHRQWAGWPLESTHSQDLERLMALAQAQGVVLDSGRVQRIASDDSPIVQIELELSLLQPWSKVRGFMASALNRSSHLALQSIRLSREEPAASVVDAELVFRWVYRREGVTP